MTRDQLISRLAAHIRAHAPVSDVARAVEEAMSERKTLGEAFDRGRWSLAAIVSAVQSVLHEDGLIA